MNEPRTRYAVVLNAWDPVEAKSYACNYVCTIEDTYDEAQISKEKFEKRIKPEKNIITEITIEPWKDIDGPRVNAAATD